MNPDFVEFRVRAKIADAKSFEKALSNFPQFEIVYKEELYPKPNTWDEELSQLKASIDKVESTVSNRNEISISGFGKIRQKVEKMATFRRITYTHTDTQMIEDVLTLFNDSYTGYLLMFRTKRPVHSYLKRTGEKTAWYKRLLGLLTPRETRILIAANGLDGSDPSTLEQINRREGLERAWQSLNAADSNLGDILLQRLSYNLEDAGL